jgi:hypothetical protein
MKRLLLNALLAPVLSIFFHTHFFNPYTPLDPVFTLQWKKDRLWSSGQNPYSPDSQWKVADASTTCDRAQDSLALLTFYHGMTGLDWNLALPIDSFSGVTLNAEGCVAKIEIISGTAGGLFPDVNLPHLKELTIKGFGGGNCDVIDNLEIAAPIPDFCCMPQLEHLTLQFFNAATPIPNFSNLPKLKSLNIVSRNLTGFLPDFAHCPELAEIRIGGYTRFILGCFPRLTDIDGQLPEYNLPDLVSLDLRYNRLTGTVPDFSTVPQATFIRLGHNNLDAIPTLNTRATLEAPYNLFTFEDILPHLSQLSEYAPQKEIPVEPLLTLNENGHPVIDVQFDAHVSGSAYVWFKNGAQVGVTPVNKLVVENTATIAGTYRVEVTNPQAPMLTLRTQDFEIEAPVITDSLDLEGDSRLAPQDLVQLFPDTIEGGIAPKQIIAAQDGGFLITGSIGGLGLLAKIDACGKLVWGREHLFGDETALKGLVELPSGQLIAVGDCLNCAPGDSSRKALVIKTDGLGLILADTTFGHANFDASAAAVVRTMDGGTAVAGSLVWASFLQPKRAFLAVLDERLQPAVWAEYDHFYRDETLGLAQTSDSGFVLAGYSTKELLAPAQAQLFRADKSGQLLWKKTSAHLDSRFNAVVETNDGKIVAFGQRLIDTLRQRDAFLAVHDSHDGELLLEKTYGSSADDGVLSLHTIEGGFLAGGYWSEPRQSGWNRRDWIFRLDENFEIRDSFFRDSYLFAHNLVNVIPLSQDGENFAYLSRRSFFSSRSVLFFKRVQQGRLFQLTAAPQHKQLYPRNLENNKGTVSYAAKSTDPGAYDEARLDVFRNGAPFRTLSSSLPGDLSFQVDIPAEAVDYTFQLLGVKNGKTYLEAEACEVVAGDAFLIQGQSNAVAGLPYDPENSIDHAYRHHRHPFVRNFGLKQAGDSIFVWYKEADDFSDYADNRSGQWGLILGKKIVEETGIPVAIINGAVSGISIDSMMPDPSDRLNSDRRYGRFLKRVERSGLKDNLRAIFMFQGETNAAGGFWDSADRYYQKFLTLDDAWAEDFPSLERRYLFQIRPGAYWTGATLLTCLQVAEAQRRVAENTEWQLMSTTGMNHDSTHYFYQNGYERAGEDIYRLVAADLYGVNPAANIYPPAIDSAWFLRCNRREISLQLRYPADSYHWTPGWETDFRLEGATETGVDSGQIEGARLILHLSSAPGPEFMGLSYTSHPGGSEAPVKNANGIGMATFYHLPVGPPPPLRDSISVLLCQGDSYLLPDGRKVEDTGTYASLLSTDEGCDSLLVTEVGFYDRITLQSFEVENDDGTGTGALSVLIGGGVPPYDYNWNTGQVSAGVDRLAAGTYTLTVTDAQGCEKVFIFEVPLMTGTAESPLANPIRIYPNPCLETLHISAPESINANMEWEIRTSRGTLVHRRTGGLTEPETIVVSNWPPGIYFLILRTGEQHYVQRIVKL